MKKLLVIAVALASVNAFATRARMNALASSPHLIDTQTVYTNAADMFFVGGDYAVIESGNTVATTVNNGAEGMVVRSMGDSKMALSLGHDSPNALLMRSAAGVPAAVATQQNPIELSYGMKAGDMAWAGTLIYSNHNDKTTVEGKEDTLGLRGGMRMGALDAYLNIGLANNASTAAYGKFKGTMGVSAGVGYMMDTMYFNGDVALAGFKAENAAGTEIAKYDQTTINLKATSSHKKDGSEFFYGAGLTNFTSKESVADKKDSSLSLPVWMGLEVDAASWLTLRGSVTQKVLINNSKSETGATLNSEYAPGPNSTVAAMGAGLKFNKVTLDGSLEGLTGGTQTQQLNGNTLFGTVGLIYQF
jgi:hypothetical protein